MVRPNMISLIQDPANRERDFIYDFGRLGLNVLPSIIARKGHLGRKKIFAAFRKYYETNGHAKASPLVTGRFKINSLHGLGIDDIAHFDLINSFALVANTVPTAFWCIYYLFSRPELLEELRASIESHSTHFMGEESITMSTVDVHVLITQVPLLSGIVKEVLRVLSASASVRVLTENTVLDDKYKLKKNALVFLPAPGLHFSTSIFGNDATEFNPERWSSEGAKFPAASFRAFGGGSSLCPGRHLSMNEIISILAVMAMKYDISPVGNKGQWKEIKTKFYINLLLWMPVEDIEVCMSQRKGLENRKWIFLWKGEKLDM